MSRFLLIVILTFLGACSGGTLGPVADSTGAAPAGHCQVLAERSAGSDDPAVDATFEAEVTDDLAEPSGDDEDGSTLGAWSSPRSVPAVPLFQRSAVTALVQATPRLIHRETPTRPPRG